MYKIFIVEIEKRDCAIKGININIESMLINLFWINYLNNIINAQNIV